MCGPNLLPPGHGMQSQQGFAKVGSFRGVYAGVPSAAIGSFPNAAAFFVTYESIKTLLGAHRALSAPYKVPVSHPDFLGEIVPCLISVPTEEVKQKTQALLSSNTYQVLLATLREEGVRGLYRGVRSAVHREEGFCLMKFPLWEYVTTQWSWRQGHTPFFWQAAVCGAFAGLCAGVEALVTNPLDVAKNRIMLDKAGTSVASRNIPLVMLDVWKSRGLTG
ncbi:S-adenosylmethionine mitochondrial carrier protein-like [Salvelinus fontinalis]|uniref:S-adenosylmethionine mitochondrial carrier protein-like n=1 Tax=Salvelinus fontinalis TaxID=8038 RepID=UPI00248655E4|nr:S-adenosylmethionine mitochondrial carrier protein-like [Salvelinus fontinalis]